VVVRTQKVLVLEHMGMDYMQVVVVVVVEEEEVVEEGVVEGERQVRNMGSFQVAYSRRHKNNIVVS